MTALAKCRLIYEYKSCSSELPSQERPSIRGAKRFGFRGWPPVKHCPVIGVVKVREKEAVCWWWATLTTFFSLVTVVMAWYFFRECEERLMIRITEQREDSFF